MTVVALLLFKNGMYKKMIVREARHTINQNFINPLAVMNCYIHENSGIPPIDEITRTIFKRVSLHGEFAIYEEEVVRRKK